MIEARRRGAIGAHLTEVRTAPSEDNLDLTGSADRVLAINSPAMCDGMRPGSQVRTRLAGGGRWIRTSGSARARTTLGSASRSTWAV